MADFSTPTFCLSIEPVDGATFQHGFHLGTDLKLAKQIAEEKFNARNKHGMPTRTVALILSGKIVDVFDGRWASDWDEDVA